MMSIVFVLLIIQMHIIIVGRMNLEMTDKGYTRRKQCDSIYDDMIQCELKQGHKGYHKYTKYWGVGIYDS